MAWSQQCAAATFRVESVPTAKNRFGGVTDLHTKHRNTQTLKLTYTCAYASHITTSSSCPGVACTSDICRGAAILMHSCTLITHVVITFKHTYLHIHICTCTWSHLHTHFHITVSGTGAHIHS